MNTYDVYQVYNVNFIIDDISAFNQESSTSLPLIQSFQNCTAVCLLLSAVLIAFSHPFVCQTHWWCLCKFTANTKSLCSDLRYSLENVTEIFSYLNIVENMQHSYVADIHDSFLFFFIQNTTQVAICCSRLLSSISSLCRVVHVSFLDII